jgi:hypothetical protein
MKGTICIPNVGNLNRDPETYGENAAHLTRLSLDAMGTLRGSYPNQGGGYTAYGFSRRQCVCRYVVNNSLFINMAVLL